MPLLAFLLYFCCFNGLLLKFVEKASAIIIITTPASCVCPCQASSSKGWAVFNNNSIVTGNDTGFTRNHLNWVGKLVKSTAIIMPCLPWERSQFIFPSLPSLSILQGIQSKLNIPSHTHSLLHIRTYSKSYIHSTSGFSWKGRTRRQKTVQTYLGFWQIG